MIVCLYFAKNVELARCLAVSLGRALLVDFPPVCGGAWNDAAVIRVGGECAFWVQLVGVADHAEEREFALFAIDDPVGVENLVAAVLGVDLREHDELGIGRVTLHLLVGFDQVVDLGGRHGEAPVDVGLVKGGWAFGHEWHGTQLGGLEVAKEVGYVVVNGFGHTVVQREHGEAEVFDAEHDAVLGGEAKVDATLDAGDAFDGAVLENVGRLGGPGGDGALTRGDEEAACALEMVVGSEQGKGALGGLIVEDVVRLDEVALDGVDRVDRKLWSCGVERVLKRGETKVGKCGTALKNDRLHSCKSGKRSKLAMDLAGNNSKRRAFRELRGLDAQL